MENDATERVLADLVETVEDGRRGFAEAADRLQEEGREDLAERMRRLGDQRGRFAAELHELATTKGLVVGQGGSLVAALHRGWMSLKDVIGGDGVSALLDAAEEGESQTVREYEKALDADIPGDVRMVISRQAAEVDASHAEVKELADRER